MHRLKTICKRSQNTSKDFALSQLLNFKGWIEAVGASFVFEDKFSIKLVYKNKNFVLKINAYDGEYFVLPGNDSDDYKMFKQISELKHWFINDVMSVKN